MPGYWAVRPAVGGVIFTYLALYLQGLCALTGKFSTDSFLRSFSQAVVNRMGSFVSNYTLLFGVGAFSLNIVFCDILFSK